MQTKKLDIAALSAFEIASLLEIFEEYYGVRQDSNMLVKRLSAWDSWLLLDGETVVGCFQLVNSCRLLDGSFLMTEFVYRWEYNSEAQICQMLQAMVRTCPPNTKYLLLDVSREHECNYECYCRFGFQRCYLTSPTSREENMVLLKALADDEGGEAASEYMNMPTGIRINKIKIPKL